MSCSTNNYPCGEDPIHLVSLSLASSGLALSMVVYLIWKLQRYERGTEEMNKLSDKIQSGARAFLVTEYKYISMFAFVAFAALLIIYSLEPPTGAGGGDRLDGIRAGGCFLAGAALSASAGWAGMSVATDANVRTTQAADKKGLAVALRVAFTGGAVMGFTVVGLGLLGLSLFFYLMTLNRSGPDTDSTDANLILIASIDSLASFGFGASSIALFARVAGGIYTKAADVGADLVGKVENDVPEDDPRNPAVIADNVGDNVGDVAGMGADLFESFVGSIIAAATLANGDAIRVALPFWIAGAGIVASIIGYFFVGVRPDATQHQLMFALEKGIISSSILVLGFAALIIGFIDNSTEGWKIYACVSIGLVSGIIIGKSTEFFTSYSYWPTQSITRSARTGPATTIIQGLGVGMISTVPTVLVLVATILGCNALFGAYGIAMAAVGMLSTLGASLATDAYGPIADNAGGISEMAGLEERVRQTTDSLDALGNTTAATGKGYAIGSAVLTSLSLLNAFKNKSGVVAVDIGDPVVLSGVLFGAMLPFLFAALTMLSVQKAAGAIIIEVRRQFAQIEGLREGTAQPDCDKCVAIATQSSIEEMILPGVYAILSPLIIGLLIGPKCLTGMLGGAIASGMMLAIMMSNSGGSWDNAKKYIEIEGAEGGKGTTTHKACVVGDTVGDPFKDTSGPSLNILIKLMSMISLTIAPIIKGWDDWQFWYWGFLPIGLCLVATILVYKYFWGNVQDITAPIDELEREDTEELKGLDIELGEKGSDAEAFESRQEAGITTEQ